MEMEQNKPPALRIGICGSASAGKSTLAEALASVLKVPCLEEEMRTYLEHSGQRLADLPRSSRDPSCGASGMRRDHPGCRSALTPPTPLAPLTCGNVMPDSGRAYRQPDSRRTGPPCHPRR